MASSKATHSCVSCYTYDRSSKGTLVTPCCARFVCGPCARSNPRLAETCILCQLPIPHDLAPATAEDLPGYDDSLPEYESAGLLDEKYHVTEQKHLVADHAFKEAGVQHYVRKDDSVASLSLAYKVDKSFIRKANHIFQDNLLQGRSFIVIPGAMKSLSAAPGADEERKVKLKKFMVAVKCTDYDMATTYMNECDYEVGPATERYKADSEWTRTHTKDVNRSQAGPSNSKEFANVVVDQYSSEKLLLSRNGSFL